MPILRPSLLAVVAFATCACRTATPTRPEITVAAAANLTQVFNQLGPRFEAATGIHPVFSFASTAQLALQIENSAPFDVFAAADAHHVDELERKNLLVPASKAIYATGVLALWIPPHSPARIAQLSDLASPDVRQIAVAKPELAPYGEATIQTLQAIHLWNRVQPKIVYAENISMARQYGSSSNVDAVFTAKSLVLHDSGTVLDVPESLHRPIAQELAILAASTHQPEARRFTAYLLTGPGKDLLKASGYRVD